MVDADVPGVQGWRNTGGFNIPAINTTLPRNL